MPEVIIAGNKVVYTTRTFTYKLQGNGVDSWIVDYLDSNNASVYKELTFISPDAIKNEEHEALGRQVIKNLYLTLRAQNLTQAQEGDLLGRTNGVFMALGFGFIRGARVLANNLTVAGQMTQARKDYLLAQIDEAITLL